MITTKGRTMNRLTELKQKTPSFGLRKRRSRRVSARGLASCGSISGSRFVRRAYEQTNVGLQPVVGQRLKEALKKKTAPPPKRVILLLLLLSTLFWAAGCENYYSSSPGLLRSRASLRRRLSRRRTRRSTLLSRPWILVWPRVLYLGARSLGMADRCQCPRQGHAT